MSVDPQRARLEVRFARFLVLALALIAITWLVEPMWALRYHISRNYNEGWNAYWADAAVSGDELYPEPTSLVTNNYPFLSFYATGYLGRLLDDTIVAGRILSTLSFLILALNIGLWLRMTGAPVIASVAPSLAFISTVAAFAPDYMGMCDLQWLGHALMTTGMVVIWRDPDRSRNVIGAMGLMAAGGWVKHLLVPLPVVITAWLGERSRKALFVWLLSATLTTAAVFLIAYACFGSNFLVGLFLTPRQFSWNRAVERSFSAARDLAPLLVLVPLCLTSWRSPRTKFVLAFLAFASFTGVIASGGQGVSKNAFFDVAIAASLATGLTLEWAGSVKLAWKRLEFAGLAPSLLLIVSWTSIGWPARVRETQYYVTHAASLESIIQDDVRFIRETGASDSACETIALCYWAGEPFHLDFFNTGQKLWKDAIPTSECGRLFGDDGYSLVQLSGTESPWKTYWLPEQCSEEIRRHYVVARTSAGGLFLVPKRRPMPQ